MKNILKTLFIAWIFVFALSFAQAQSAPTNEETGVINTKLNAFYTQIKAMQTRAEWDAAAEAFVADAENKAIVKKLYDWAMANPVAFRQWFDARGDGQKNYQLKQWLVFYKRAYDEDTALTLNQCAVAFQFAEWWKPANKTAVIAAYNTIKAAGWKVEGFDIGAHMVMALAQAQNDSDAIINASDAVIIGAGLDKYLPALEKILASSSDRKAIWDAYTRTRKIITPYQGDAKNAPYWSRLVADEYLAWQDYKRNR